MEAREESADSVPRRTEMETETICYREIYTNTFETLHETFICRDAAAFKRCFEECTKVPVKYVVKHTLRNVRKYFLNPNHHRFITWTFNIFLPPAFLSFLKRSIFFKKCEKLLNRYSKNFEENFMRKNISLFNT